MEKDNEIKSTVATGEKNHTAIIALVILVLVIAMGFRGYYFYKKLQVSDPVKITTNKIMALSNEATKALDGSDFFTDKKATKVTIDGNIADYSFNFESGLDLKNSVMQVLLSIDNKSDSLLYLDSNVTKNGMIFQVAKDSNSYKLSDNLSEIFSTMSEYTDLVGKNYSEKLFKYLAESFEENYKTEDFEKTKEKVTILDKEMDTTKYETTIDKEDLVKILSTFIDKIAKDEDFVNLMVDTAKYTGEEITPKEAKEGFALIKENLDEIVPEVKINYSIYVKGADVVRLSFALADADMSLKIDTYKNNESISVNFNGTRIAVNYNKKSAEYSITMNGVSMISGTYREKNAKNNSTVNLTFSIPLMGIDGEINMKMEVEKDLKGKSFDNPLDINKEENAEKLMKELEDNEFLNSLVEMLDSMLGNSQTWDSIDGINI